MAASSTPTTPLGAYPRIQEKKALWFAISGIVILAGLVSLFTRGMNWGIDFTGGALFQYRMAHAVAKHSTAEREALSKARAALREAKVEQSQIQVSDGNLLLVRTNARDHAQASAQSGVIRKALEKRFPGIEQVGLELVGPVIGRELKRKALLATVIGLVCILAFVTIRYEFLFAVSGIVALVHDVLVVVGGMSLLQVEVNSAFVAALLTVVGYSINDTVVIFDRIRENMRLYRRQPFDDVVNASLWQTLARSLLTSLTTLFVLLTLFLFGGATIHGLSLALLVGITSGAYSSICTASPVLSVLRRQAEKRQRVATPSRPRPRRESRPRPEPRPAVTAQQPVASPEAEPTAAADPVAVGADSGSSPARKKRGGKRRGGGKKSRRKRRH